MSDVEEKEVEEEKEKEEEKEVETGVSVLNFSTIPPAI